MRLIYVPVCNRLKIMPFLNISFSQLGILIEKKDTGEKLEVAKTWGFYEYGSACMQQLICNVSNNPDCKKLKLLHVIFLDRPNKFACAPLFFKSFD